MEATQSAKPPINDKEESDEFYEKIEAPKFVDLTVPDSYRPDDRYWFCLRVGCDQKHEEELDSEAIYKNFVLRVMAARSPNVRLQKVMNRKPPSANMKCPKSAPPKSSKARISRLALISSISQKIGEVAKVKVRPISKPNSTPKVVKAKQSSFASKALTTPRHKKCLPNQNSFRSVRNPKATTVAEPKTRVIAKALVFNSPKKIVRSKYLSKVDTPVRRICEGMKKLEITSQRKSKIPLPLEASSKKSSALKAKSRAENSANSQNYKAQKGKSLRCLKEKREECCDFVQFEGVENESSDMEIDGRSRNGSLEVHSLSGIPKSNEGSTNCAQEKAFPSLEKLPSEGTADSVLPNENSNINLQALNEEGNENAKEVKHEERKESGLEKLKVSEDETPEYQSSEGAGQESEVPDSDDKENASASDDNRELNLKTETGREPLGRKKTCENNQKDARTLNRTLKEGLTSTTTSVQGVKYRKPKPTNPKPFRLRTDERGILKEANLERRLHNLLVPSRETATFPRFPIGNSQRNHENDIQKKENLPGQSKSDNDSNEGREKELEKINQQTQLEEVITAPMKTKQERTERTGRTNPEKQTASTNRKPNLVSSPSERGNKSAEKSENTLRKTKPSLLQQELVRSQGVNSTRKAIVSFRIHSQLSVIREETSSKLSRPEAGKPSESSANPTTKGSASTPSRSSSRGKRPITIPKEPNFHSLHVPRSCTKQLT